MKKNSAINAISPVTNVILNFIFLIFTCMCVYPLLIIAGTSIASKDSIIKYGYSIFPKSISFEAYDYIVENSAQILRAYGVTIFVTVVGTILSTAVICLYAYPLSRKEFKYKKFFTLYAFITMLFSGGLVPWYMVCTQILHIQDTIFALFLPTLFSTWYVIVMRTFFTSTVPDAMVESARIDGANEFRILFGIVMPISLPGMATIALFTTLGYWNDWWLSMILTTKHELVSLQFYLYKIVMNLQILLDDAKLAATLDQNGAMSSNITAESARMAICLIAVGPIVLAYPFFQKYFVQGLTIGSVKG